MWNRAAEQLQDPDNGGPSEALVSELHSTQWLASAGESRLLVCSASLELLTSLAKILRKQLVLMSRDELCKLSHSESHKSLLSLH